MWLRLLCGAASKRARHANHFKHSERNVITMAAISAVPAMPDRNAYMARVADRFRTLRRKLIQVAKKAGNWFINLTPVNWAWRVAKSATSKVWNWVRPAVSYTHRYIVRPAAIGAGAAVGFVFGSKLIALLTGLGVVGLIAVTIYVVRKRGKEKVVGLEVVSTGAPEEPEEKPKKTPRKRIAEAVDKVADALEESADVINTAAKEAAADTVETAKVKRAAAEAAEAESEAILEAAKDAVAEANQAAAEVRTNGHYKVRLPEGDLDPNETLDHRFNDLDVLINAEMNKPLPDPEFLCELQGRQNMVHVRGGKHSKVKKDATAAMVHKDYAETLEATWMSENDARMLAPKEETGIYRGALHQGAIAESARIRKIEVLKAEHDRLKGKAA